MVKYTIPISNHPGYESWHSMKQRCRSKRKETSIYYSNIYFCSGLDSFKDFIGHLGEKPGKTYSLDRIDGHNSYTCGCCSECLAKGDSNNVRWATASEQMINRDTPSDNKSGYMGIKIRHEYSPVKYSVRIAKERNIFNIGTYETLEEALSARLMAESVYWS